MVKRILIAEDEALSALYLKRFLSEAGYEVCGIAATETAAVTIAENQPTDLLLFDIRLARHSSGISAARTIRGFLPEIPVIFMTGYDSQEIFDSAADLTPIKVIIKPVTRAILHEIIGLIKGL
jgi:DNA-binding NarL/FixJ family response regulator